MKLEVETCDVKTEEDNVYENCNFVMKALEHIKKEVNDEERIEMTPEKDIKMENISDDEVEEDIEDEESNIEQESNKMEDAQVMEVKLEHAAHVEMQTPGDLVKKLT